MGLAISRKRKWQFRKKLALKCFGEELDHCSKVSEAESCAGQTLIQELMCRASAWQQLAHDPEANKSNAALTF